MLFFTHRISVHKPVHHQEHRPPAQHKPMGLPPAQIAQIQQQLADVHNGVMKEIAYNDSTTTVGVSTLADKVTIRGSHNSINTSYGDDEIWMAKGASHNKVFGGGGRDIVHLGFDLEDATIKCRGNKIVIKHDGEKNSYSDIELFDFNGVVMRDKDLYRLKNKHRPDKDVPGDDGNKPPKDDGNHPPQHEDIKPPKDDGNHPPKDEDIKPPKDDGNHPPKDEDIKPPKDDGNHPPQEDGNEPPKGEGNDPIDAVPNRRWALGR